MSPAAAVLEAASEVRVAGAMVVQPLQPRLPSTPSCSSSGALPVTLFGATAAEEALGQFALVP